MNYNENKNNLNEQTENEQKKFLRIFPAYLKLPVTSLILHLSASFLFLITIYCWNNALLFPLLILTISVIITSVAGEVVGIDALVISIKNQKSLGIIVSLIAILMPAIFVFTLILFSSLTGVGFIRFM